MSSLEDILERVSQVLEYIDDNTGSINNLPSHLLQYIPMYVWKSQINRISIEARWDDLPFEVQSELYEYKPCYDHHNVNRMDTDADIIDGPPPAKAHCDECKRNNNKK